MFCCCSTTHKSTEAEIIAPFTIEKEPEEGKIVKVGDPGEKLVISLVKFLQLILTSRKKANKQANRRPRGQAHY